MNFADSSLNSQPICMEDFHVGLHTLLSDHVATTMKFFTKLDKYLLHVK